MQSLKPDFLIIGAAKAATTMLSGMLDRHPQAGIVQGKEPHFFSMDPIYARGWQWYQSCFQRCRGKRVLGDASTSYSRIRYHPNTVARIRQHIPNVKIIYMVRHPLERIESAYVERLASIDASRGYADINHAVRAEPMMIDSSRYWEVFDYYRHHFDERRIKLVWFEEFISNTDAVFADICRFLELDTTVAIAPDPVHRNSRAQVIGSIEIAGAAAKRTHNTTWTAETRGWVLEQIREDNTRLLKYFDRPLDYWDGLFTGS